jgi:hypothetical protein
MNRKFFKIISPFVFASMVFGLTSQGYAQGVSYDKDLKTAVIEKLKDYKAQSRAAVYLQQILAKFDKASAPSDSPLKRHIGIAISLDDTLCESADQPCEPLIYPAALAQEDTQVALTALRRRSDRKPPGEADPNSYVEQFLSGSLKLGATPEFKMLARSDLPASSFGEVKVLPQEWIVQDRVSVSALRQSGPWLLAVSSDRSLKHTRILIYAFPSTMSMDERDKIFIPAK